MKDTQHNPRANTDHRHIASEGAEKSPQVINYLYLNGIYPSQKKIRREKSGSFPASRVGTGQPRIWENPKEVWGSIGPQTWGCPQCPASHPTACLLTARLPFRAHWKQHLFHSSTFKWLRSLQRQLNYLMCLTGPFGRFSQSFLGKLWLLRDRGKRAGARPRVLAARAPVPKTPALLPAVPPPAAAREQEVSPALSPCFCHCTYWCPEFCLKWSGFA